MTHSRLVAARLASQRLTKPAARDPAALVSWFGAVQAQEYPLAKWGLALRMRGQVSDTDVTRAVDEGRILRTHIMRPTWHFVAAADIRWMQALTAPRVHRALEWGHRQNGTDAALRRRATRAIERALTDEAALTRPELAERLARVGIPVRRTALALVIIHAELECVICSGPRSGTRSTYALLGRRVPESKALAGDEALAELTRRYFQSHGPATVRDFAWWSGLTTADVKRGLEIVKARPHTIDERTYWTLSTVRASEPPAGVHLLPIYDEYLVAYRDLDIVPRGNSRWGMLPQVVISRGHVAGVWKPVREGDRFLVDVQSQRRLTPAERSALHAEVERYGRFQGLTSTLRLA